LLVASEDFSRIEVRRVGVRSEVWDIVKLGVRSSEGFTTLRKLPGLNDTYIALKLAEFANATHDVQTVLTVSISLGGS